MVDNYKNENKDMCRMCGGMCCKKSGCDYSANNFSDLSYEGIKKELGVGDKSIVCVLEFKKDSLGKYFYIPFLYIRARNVGRDVIDLVSMKKKCALLLDNGCSYDYDNRPEGGRNLIPCKNLGGKCFPLNNPVDIVKTWEPYQKILRRIVKEYTGMDLKTRISFDVENLFYDVLSDNYQDVSIIERRELKSFVVMLSQIFPGELHNANARYKKERPKVLIKSK